MSEVNNNLFELTSFERTLANHCQVGDLNVMATAFLEPKDGQKPLRKETVLRALEFLQARHPFWRAYLDIRRQEDRMFFVLLGDDEHPEKKIELDWVQTESRNAAIQLSGEFNAKLFNHDNKQLLWRCQVISYPGEGGERFVVSIVCHTCITDGFNIIALKIELVNIINALETGSECEEMRVRLSPPENSHELCAKTGLYREEHQQKVEELAQKPVFKFKFDEKFKSGNETGFLLDYSCLDKATTGAIVAMSREHKVRITAYLQTVAFYALKKLYAENNLDLGRISLPIVLILSLRIRFEPVYEFHHSRYYTAFFTVPSKHETFDQLSEFWRIAKDIQTINSFYLNSEEGSIFASTHNYKFHDFLNKISKEGKSQQEICENLHALTCTDISLSNLGPYSEQRAKFFPGPFEIDQIFCSDSLQSVPNSLEAMMMHFLLWKGRMMLQFGANRWTLNEKYFRRYIQLFIETVNQSLDRN